MKDAKPWYKSKTLWFNALVAAMATAEAMSGILRDELSPLVYVFAMMIVAAVNMGLRSVTERPITIDRRYDPTKGPAQE